jgi:hypothetical protein
MRVRLLSISLLLALSLGGCSSYRPRSVPQPPAPMQRLTGDTRITLEDGSIYDLRNVIVATDSLFGTMPGSTGRMAVPLVQITRLEQRGRDLTLTALTVVGIAVLLLLPRAVR